MACVYMGVSKNRGTQQPWVFLLKMIILGCLGVPLFSETSIYIYIYIYISASQATSSSVGGPKHSESADYPPKIVVPQAPQAAQHYITARGKPPHFGWISFKSRPC